MISITSDIDWANDKVISYMLDILKQYNIQATLFCTHDVSAVKNIKNHELGIHPNFMVRKSNASVIKELKALFPEARGIRSHCLYVHDRLFDIYPDFGIEYESNYLIPNQIVNPFHKYNNVFEIPIFFEDDLYFSNAPLFTVESLDIERPGVKVFSFHPIHIFLNTQKLSDYQEAKKYLQEPDKLLKYRKKGKGIGSLFIELLEFIRTKQLKTYTLGEINDYWRKLIDQKYL